MKGTYEIMDRKDGRALAPFLSGKRQLHVQVINGVAGRRHAQACPGPHGREQGALARRRAGSRDLGQPL